MGIDYIPFFFLFCRPPSSARRTFRRFPPSSEEQNLRVPRNSPHLSLLDRTDLILTAGRRPYGDFPLPARAAEITPPASFFPSLPKTFFLLRGVFCSCDAWRCPRLLFPVRRAKRHFLGSSAPFLPSDYADVHHPLFFIPDGIPSFFPLFSRGAPLCSEDSRCEAANTVLPAGASIPHRRKRPPPSFREIASPLLLERRLNV